MKILFLSNLYPPNVVGGYERLCHQVAAKLGQRGHEIIVLTSDFGPPVTAPTEGVTHRTLKLLCDSRSIYEPFPASSAEREAINAHNLAELRRVVADVRPDLIFGWNLFFLDSAFHKALGQLGVPTALFLTDNWLIAAETPERIHRHFERHVHGDEPFLPHHPPADQQLPYSAIFGSAFVQNLYRSCGYGFEREMVVHNGVTAPFQDAELSPDRTALYRSGELRLLFAGRLVDIKGPQDCIAALPLIQSAVGPAVRVSLTIVGDASDVAFKTRLEQQIAASGLGETVTVLPTAPEGELIDIFNTHDLFLFPSLYEPFALTLILAMAVGIPTIASDIGGNPEIVLHNRTGWLYPKGDAAELASAVVDLYTTPHRRAELAQRGRRFARRFSFGRMIDNLEHALESLVGVRAG